MKKIPSIKILYKKYSKNKLQVNTAFSDENWYSRFFGRRISIFFTWIFLHLGLTPNMITFICLILGIVGSFLIAVPKVHYLLAGSILFQLYMILDSSDGEVARITNQKSLLGSYLDKLIHIFIYTALYVALGLNIYIRTGNLSYVLLGILVSLVMSLASTIHYLDPLLTRMPYLESRNIQGTIVYFAVNIYNLLTGDIEIVLFLSIAALLQYLDILNFDFFKAILFLNLIMITFGGIFISLILKIKDPRYYQK